MGPRGLERSIASLVALSRSLQEEFQSVTTQLYMAARTCASGMSTFGGALVLSPLARFLSTFAASVPPRPSHDLQGAVTTDGWPAYCDQNSMLSQASSCKLQWLPCCPSKLNNPASSNSRGNTAPSRHPAIHITSSHCDAPSQPRGSVSCRPRHAERHT